MESIIQLKQVNKWYGDFHVLKDINFEVSEKEKVVICGPSGSGKSTLIRCINRLEEHQKGEIIVDGMTLDENTKNISAIRSEVGMVFQQFNLFPHLSILENCTLAQIWVKKKTKKESEALAMDYLKKFKLMIRLQSFQDSYQVDSNKELQLQERFVWNQRLCFLMSLHLH